MLHLYTGSESPSEVRTMTTTNETPGSSAVEPVRLTVVSDFI